MRIALTHAAHRAPLASLGVPTFCLDSEWELLAGQPVADPPAAATSGDMIYVIFTSGSTGVPKGAGVYHGGFANLMHWMNGEFCVTADDRSLIITSHGFDTTQKAMFAPLMVGGELHFSTYEAFDPRHIAAEIERDGISLLISTPSAFYTIVETSDEQLSALSPLREVLLAGEPLDLRRLARWLRHPACRAEVANNYGPTECTDIVGFYRVPKHDPCTGFAPLGRPVYNSKLYVVDRHLALAPVGVIGELCLGGVCVGAGYINDPDLTAKKFLPDPFSSQPGARLYRTGDLCRWLPTGDIEFLGRADSQLKIRGFRIELGDIEAALSEHAAVRDAVVVAREDVLGEKRLVAYVVPADPRPMDETALPATMVEFLKQRLPHYMVPRRWSSCDNCRATRTASSIAGRFPSRRPTAATGRTALRRAPKPSATWPTFGTNCCTAVQSE
jgi:amino acid adenylation domain-containing protein